MREIKTTIKKRKFKAIHLIVLLLCIIVVFFILYRLNIRRNLRLREKSIRDAGYPVTLQELNQWYSVPMDVENAAYIILDSFDYYQEPAQETLIPIIGKVELPPRAEPLSDETVNVISQFLSDNRESLELLHKVMDLEYGRYPVDFSYGMGTRIDHLQGLGKSLRMLMLEALYFAECDDQKSAVNSILSIMGLARSLSNEPVGVSQNFCLTCRSNAVSTLELIVNINNVNNDEDLIKLCNVFKQAQQSYIIPNALIGERCVLLSVFLEPHSYYFNSESLAFFPPVLFLYKSIGLNERDAIIYLDFIDEYLKIFTLPTHEWQKAANEIDTKINDIPGSYILLDNFIPTFSHFIEMELNNIAKLRTAQAAMAIQRYRLKNGRLPDSLDNLVPEYIESVPLDPYDGKELRYKKLDMGFVVYSIGKDLVDDSGKERPDNDSKRKDSTYDITFIIER